ncbi:restriction endonuclease [Nocardioides sp. ChNu-99]|uniref:restriction endonuclease n=1 Tax=Nocardioides sp. ChNu-99 TaxID=2839897 RepID=UPI002406387E|nr:restriction endonuclease [Nocardioides sp. ChNu-99]MDF9717876.1 restriction endonuclease [Nocardioides sp. ChNu-99]
MKWPAGQRLFLWWDSLVERFAADGLVTCAEVICDLPTSYAPSGSVSDLEPAKAAARRVLNAADRYYRTGVEPDTKRVVIDGLQCLVVVRGRYQADRASQIEAEIGAEVGVLALPGESLTTVGVAESEDGADLFAIGSLFAIHARDGWDYGLNDVIYLRDEPPYPLPVWEGLSLGASAARAYMATSAIIRTETADALWSFYNPYDDAELDRLMDPETRRAAVAEVQALLGPQRGQSSGLGRPILPPPRMLRGHRESEHYAAEVLAALGFAQVRRTPDGSDGGVDVDGPEVVAQVKMEALPTGRERIQALAGVAAVERKRAVFFSLAGYTAPAVEWGDRAGVVLFQFAFDGSVEAINDGARRLLARGHGRA